MRGRSGVSRSLALPSCRARWWARWKPRTASASRSPLQGRAPTPRPRTRIPQRCQRLGASHGAGARGVDSGATRPFLLAVSGRSPRMAARLGSKAGIEVVESLMRYLLGWPHTCRPNPDTRAFDSARCTSDRWTGHATQGTSCSHRVMQSLYGPAGRAGSALRG